MSGGGKSREQIDYNAAERFLSLARKAREDDDPNNEDINLYLLRVALHFVTTPSGRLHTKHLTDA